MTTIEIDGSHPVKLPSNPKRPRNRSQHATAPIFVLTLARSGSTLLKTLLGNHPNIHSPEETNLSAALTVVGRAFLIAQGQQVNSSQVQENADRLCRQVATEIMGQPTKLAGKLRWCDKSLTSIAHSEGLARLYPDAQFVCLYRNCADVIASGLEASPYGLLSYGFEPYVRDTPTNQVLALTRYWIDQVELLMSFEQSHPQSCFRILYEDFVTSADQVLPKLFTFLNEPFEPSARATTLRPQRFSPGPRDYKISFTGNIEDNSIGHGWYVPFDMVPSQLRERVSQQEKALGYTNQSSRSVTTGTTSRSVTDKRSRSIPRDLRALVRHMNAFGSIAVAEPSYDDLPSFSINFADVEGSIFLDGSSKRATINGVPSAYKIFTSFEVLTDAIRGLTNFGVLLRRNLIQIHADGGPQTSAFSERILQYLFEALSSKVRVNHEAALASCKTVVPQQH